MIVSLVLSLPVYIDKSLVTTDKRWVRGGYQILQGHALFWLLLIQGPYFMYISMYVCTVYVYIEHQLSNLHNEDRLTIHC